MPFHFSANAKQQQQAQQKLVANNAAIINLSNATPVNSDTNAAVVNTINSSLLPHQIQAINKKILARKMTIPNVTNARVFNHGNVITLNNNCMNLQELAQQQPQTITLTSVNSGNYTNFTTVPVKQHVVNQRILSASSSDSNKSALSALLVGTPAADRPDIVGSNTNSLFTEKLGSVSGSSQGATHFIQNPKGGQAFMVQSPKANTVLSPMSSPPPQNTNTINVQSLNFAQLQSIQGLQNLVQLPGFGQPSSLLLNLSSAGNIQGHQTSLIVTLPVTTATQTSTTITQAAVNSSRTGVNNIGVGGQTVVLANAGTSNLGKLDFFLI